MTDATTKWPTAGSSRTNLDPGSVSGDAPAAGPPPLRLYRPRFVVASLVILYLVGVAIGWATHGIDGNYGITRVDTPPAEPSRLTIVEVAAGGPADRAGLRPGHVVLAVHGDRLGGR